MTEKLQLEKLQFKPLKKLVARLVKKYGLRDELCPNLSKKQKGGALQYMLYKRYVDKTIGESTLFKLIVIFVEVCEKVRFPFDYYCYIS